ncbi:hypothetical protein [Chitinophaga solisilvae]|uniref:Uncharacterized protein n=1 Tax=Chitinophaga solisilvae TaxID=1233460 RepID=A0A3S1B2H8_9BACT|nr:hypothetical protein [Chitinophaga solisilvae]NSL89203.1 hypothetical protein [Chitinophaga solisilvae]
MLISNKRALKVGVMTAAVLGIAFTSCKKDDAVTPPPPAARSKTFQLSGAGADAAKTLGTVTILENNDKTVNVTLTLAKSTKDAAHQLYFVFGPKTAPTTDTLLAKEIKGTGAEMKEIELFSKVSTIKVRQAAGASKDTAFKFDNAVAYAAHLKVMQNKTSTDTLAIGNFGKSAN